LVNFNYGGIKINNNAEENVSRFYNYGGWKVDGQITEDAKKFEDLREYASEYVSKCRLRLLRHIPKKGENILDMASGPIQYKEYIEYSKNFNKRYCVDLSSDALLQAQDKISDHGIFFHGSFFEIEFEKDYFDCSISVHTIYHIDKNKQEEAVRKLIHVTKPEHPIVIIYSNPKTLISFLKLPFHLLKRPLMALNRTGNKKEKEELTLYFFAHDIKWWKRFSDVAKVEIYPWRSFDARAQQLFFPNNKIGKKMLQILFLIEDKFPNLFVSFFQYPMIILKKK
jgi:ubiquinone/menaquinone biosynthesis C-methylase UbiE